MLLQLLTPPAPVLATAAKVAPVKSAKPGASLTAAARAAVQVAAILRSRPAILARAPISLVGAGSLRNARTAATPTPGAPPAPAFNLEAWLATARAYWDPEDATKVTLSGSDLVSLTSKGTLGALLAKVLSGGAIMGTLGGRAALDATALRLDVRNAGDTLNVALGDVVGAGASCFVFAVRFPSASNRGLAADAGGYIAQSGATSATYYDTGNQPATGPALADGTPGIVSIQHDGAFLTVSLNGVAGTPRACLNIGSVLAALRIIAAVTGLIGKIAVWNVPIPTDYAAGIAAMKAHYAIT
jgi:hypothetical protein